MKDEPNRQEDEFTLDDFKRQLEQISKLGPIQRTMSMIPGMGGLAKASRTRPTEAELRRLIGVIDSMTPDERQTPEVARLGSRRNRIAAGAGAQPHEVTELLKKFSAMSSTVREFAAMSILARVRALWRRGH